MKHKSPAETGVDPFAARETRALESAPEPAGSGRELLCAAVELAAAREALDAPPAPFPSLEPLAVYLHWLLIGVAAGSFALLFPVSRALEFLAALLPRWSQACGAGAIALLLLALVERARRDRKPVGLALGAGAALLAGLALDESLLQGYAVEPAWFAVLAGALLGAAQLLFIEDWLAGRCGPRVRQLALALRDSATLPWWFWFSKRALAQRALNRAWQSELREQREREWVARKSAEDLAEQVAAERRASEDRLAAARAAEEAAAAERRAATEQRAADEVKKRVAELELARASVEHKLAQARATTEDLNRHAEAAALERTRLRREQIEAERRFIEAATAARAAAETALECGVEAARAQALVERMQDELALADASPRSQAYG